MDTPDLLAEALVHLRRAAGMISTAAAYDSSPVLSRIGDILVAQAATIALYSDRTSRYVAKIVPARPAPQTAP